MAYGAIIGQTPTVQASAEMTSYNNDNTSSVITADNVQGAIDQLFTSVSNGKSQIASAITGMGVSTSANDSFAQMATNISNIETGYDTSQVTATANTVRSGYKFVNSSGQLITGTIPSKGAQTYTPRTVSQTIAKGQYLSGNQTIQGDGNLVASNIKSGVSIFGVRGNFEGNIFFRTVHGNDDKTITIPDVKSMPNEVMLLMDVYNSGRYWDEPMTAQTLHWVNSDDPYDSTATFLYEDEGILTYTFTDGIEMDGTLLNGELTISVHDFSDGSSIVFRSSCNYFVFCKF